MPRCDGLSTKPIKTAYSATAGTAFVTFDKVCVPLSNTLGKEGKGMLVILSNFNHERASVAQQVVYTEYGGREHEGTRRGRARQYIWDQYVYFDSSLFSDHNDITICI